MKLYVLIRSLEDATPRLTYRLLQEACENQNIELIPLEQEKMSFGKNTRQLIDHGSAFYRLSTGPAQILAEQLLIRPDLSTIYEPWRIPPAGSAWMDSILMLSKDLPIIPTVFLFAFLSREQIEKEVEKLGGYPVVAKYTGLSHGKGIFLCENYHAIAGLVARYESRKPQLALRSFIRDAVHLRAVVIGNETVDVIRYQQPDGDFRTNAVAVPLAEPYEATGEIKKLALDAAQAYGVRLAGVDILLDGDGKPWLAEVNTPCNYARNYLTNGKNLAIDLVKNLSASR